MLLDDLGDEVEGEEIVDCLNNPDELLHSGLVEEQVKFSLHVMRGTSGCQTMQIAGMIKNRAVIMLVDSGSTHNFINVGVAKNLKLGCNQQYQSLVTIANDDNVRTMGKCSKRK